MIGENAAVKNLKRGFCLFLTMLMLFSLLPTSALAEGEEEDMLMENEELFNAFETDGEENLENTDEEEDVPTEEPKEEEAVEERVLTEDTAALEEQKPYRKGTAAGVSITAALACGAGAVPGEADDDAEHDAEDHREEEPVLFEKIHGTPP